MKTNKTLRYLVAFLLSVAGILFIALVGWGYFPTLRDCLIANVIGYTSLYYGQKLAWLTWKPVLQEPRSQPYYAIHTVENLHRKRDEEAQRRLIL